MTELKLSSNAMTIFSKLNAAGFEAYVVGGAVRDHLMGKVPHDIDIASNATPEDIKKVFEDFHVIEMGIAFGIVTVVVNGEPFEIAQFRKDVGGNGRKPDVVEPVREVEVDLARRDFTMNAIAFDPIKGIIRDPFAGAVDIMDREIDFVGCPLTRIREDKLRILRAFRFMSQLGFSIEWKSLDNIKWFVETAGEHTFENVSQERIMMELSKILVGPNAFETVKLMFEVGLMQLIIPETTRLHEEHNCKWHKETLKPFGNTILAHVLNVVRFASLKVASGMKYDAMTEHEGLILMLAALLHDIGKPLVREAKPDGTDRFHTHDVVGANLTREILTRMKFSGDIVDRVTHLVKKHMNMHDLPKMKKVHKIRRMLATEDFKLMMLLGFCDTMGSSFDGVIPNEVEANEFKETVRELIKVHGTVLPEPIITGNDLILEGMKPGPDFKDRLYHTFNLQLCGEEDRTKLLNHAKGLKL